MRKGEIKECKIKEIIKNWIIWRNSKGEIE